MARTRKLVIEHATFAPNEVLVVFDNDGTLENRLLRDHADLKATLIATPLTIANPARTDGAPDDVPATIPNPARAAAEATAFDAAEAEIAEEVAAAAAAAAPAA